LESFGDNRLMLKRKGYTMVELMIVILIVSILSAVAVPILRGRINAAKWTEGRTMAGTIAVAIRTYIAGTGNTGVWDENTLTYTLLGFKEDDFNGSYFSKDNFRWQVEYTGGYLTYKVTVTKPDGVTSPAQMTLDYKGNWGQ